MTERREPPNSEPPRDLPPVELICQISRCQRLLQQQLNELSGRWQLSGTEMLILWLCARNAATGLSQRELAATIGISTARLSGLVEGLRGRQLISPWRPPGDRRRQYWRLEAAGRNRLAAAGRGLEEFARTHLRDVPAASQRQLAARLGQLADLLEEGPATDRGPGGGTGQAACTEADDDRVYRRAS